MKTETAFYLAGVIDGHNAVIEHVETALAFIKEQKKTVEDQLENLKKTGTIDPEIGISKQGKD